MWALAIHGGAGSLRPATIDADCRVMDDVATWAADQLSAGVAALDVVEGAIRRLEDSGAFVAGKGSYPNLAGEWELDASICDGATQRCGAVAALRGFYPPISIARAVMERTPHVFLVGDGAALFARESGFAEIADPAHFFLGPVPPRRSRDDGHGTVGAVALDERGNIAAGTSTGGTTAKMRGRVGDSPIVGAGSWADATVGVSCTGSGEFFIRSAAAHSVAAYRNLLKLPLIEAADASLAEVARLGGRGGLIAVDGTGDVHYVYNSEAIRIGIATSAGRRDIRVAQAPQTRSESD